MKNHRRRPSEDSVFRFRISVFAWPLCLCASVVLILLLLLLVGCAAPNFKSQISNLKFPTPPPLPPTGPPRQTSLPRQSIPATAGRTNSALPIPHSAFPQVTISFQCGYAGSNFLEWSTNTPSLQDSNTPFIWSTLFAYPPGANVTAIDNANLPGKIYRLREALP